MQGHEGGCRVLLYDWLTDVTRKTRLVALQRMDNPARGGPVIVKLCEMAPVIIVRGAGTVVRHSHHSGSLN